MDMIYGLMTIIIISELLIIIFLWVKKEDPKEYIDGKTIIELKIMADKALSNPDKAKLLHQESNDIDWDEVEIWMKDEILSSLINNIGKNNVVSLN